MERIILTLKNPWSGAIVDRDVTELTEQELDHYAQLMDSDLRERLHDELTPCSPGMFLKAWSDEVSLEEASRIILGS